MQKIHKEKPIWMKRTKEEVEEIIVKLAKQGISEEKIGLVLRDAYGIPSSKLLTKKISHVLKEKNLTRKIPVDVANLIKRAEVLKKHLNKNKKDMPAKRSLLITKSKINKLLHYYKKKKVIPEDFA